uniref:Uncharacterized protein n=1 Tax=Ditylum brightwellii TaxID=49249 RepID=A0A6V2LQ40_9STRA
MKLSLPLFLSLLSIGSVASTSTYLRHLSSKSRSSKSKSSSQSRGRSSKSSKSQPEWYSPSVSSVYMMTNEPINEILIFSRNDSSGKLDFVNAVRSNGSGLQLSGGTALSPPTDDPLASQDSLVVAGNCLLAVNAGSNTVSSFRINSARDISFVETVDSGGEIPVSIAVNEDLVYVLNAGGVGSIAAFSLFHFNCKLTSIGDPIELSQTFESASGPPSLPFFPASPAQIGFTPENNLLVTIKANGAQDGDGSFPSNGSLNVYKLDKNGLTSAKDLTQTEVPNNSIPFSFAFDDEGQLLVAEAFGAAGVPNVEAGGSVSLYNDLDSFIPTIESEVTTTEVTTCWVRYNKKKACAFTTNNGGGSISSMKVRDGKLHLVEDVAAQLDTPIDFDFSSDYEFLYALSTGHLLSDDLALRQPAIFVYKISSDCGLEKIQEITEGIPTEADRELNSLGVVNGVVGLAIF